MGAADLQLHLYEALVRPVLDFGAPIWGPMVVQQGGVKAAEDMHLRFLRQVFGVKASVPGAVLLREMGGAPVWATWVRRAARFWNRVVKRGPADLVRVALAESCEAATAGGAGAKAWAAHMAAAVARVSAGLGQAWQLDLDGMAALPSALVEATGAARGMWWRLGLTGDAGKAIEKGEAEDMEVRDVPDRMREGFKGYTHHRWFAVPGGVEEGIGRCFWQVLRSRAAVRRVAQMRMGAHRLAIEEGRFSKVPRADRLCVLCPQGRREDERHFVFECERYANIRRKYSDLFGGADMVPLFLDSDVRQWMNPPPERAASFWHRFNAFLFECWLSRTVGVALWHQ